MFTRLLTILLLCTPLSLMANTASAAARVYMQSAFSGQYDRSSSVLSLSEVSKTTQPLSEHPYRLGKMLPTAQFLQLPFMNNKPYPHALLTYYDMRERRTNALIIRLFEAKYSPETQMLNYKVIILDAPGYSSVKSAANVLSRQELQHVVLLIDNQQTKPK